MNIYSHDSIFQKLDGNFTERFSWDADNESVVRIWKFTSVVPPKKAHFSIFSKLDDNLTQEVFSGRLITNLGSELQNSRNWSQYALPPKMDYFSKLGEISTRVVFGVAEHESEDII
ncbi:hypothetical protein JTB14_024088 [Gonioctena quinquepunctata]|nr:hypothetical protein JTB14_024088 [Gonioctena quinquepunctata]